MTSVIDFQGATDSERIEAAIRACTDGVLIIPRRISDIEPEEYALAYNPQTFRLHFGSETPDRLTFTASVYSLGGAKVGTFRASEGFDMSACPAGVYVVTWKTGGKTRSAKFRR